MENEHRLKNMIFRYLDELFKNIKIEVMEWPEFRIGMIPTDTGKMILSIEGRVGNSSVFTYFHESNTISFNRHELKTIVDFFTHNGKEGLDYVKSYLIKNVDGIPDDVTIYVT